MRLYKKAAACLLAAAMAVSMMTACGGGAGGGSGVAQGTTYTNSEGLVAGIDENSETGTQTLEYKDSRYAKMVGAADSMYMEFRSASVENGQLGEEQKTISAATKTRSYSKTGEGADAEEILIEKDGTDAYLYTFVESENKKVAVKEKTTIRSSSTAGMTMRSAHVTVNGAPYYAEIMTQNGHSTTLCYKENSPVPTYQFDGYDAYVYKQICIGSDKGLCASALAGREVYTVESVDLYNMKATVKDSKGNVYNAEGTWSASGVKWTVKNGENEVPELAKLVEKYVKLRYGA